MYMDCENCQANTGLLYIYIIGKKIREKGWEQENRQGSSNNSLLPWKGVIHALCVCSAAQGTGLYQL